MPFRRAPSCATGPRGEQAHCGTYPCVHHNTLRRRWVDTHALALVRQGLLKLDVPVDQGIERIVPAHAHVDTRLPARATLAEDDTAGRQVLAAEFLHAESLRLAIAPIARATHSLLVCHRCRSPRLSTRCPGPAGPGVALRWPLPAEAQWHRRRLRPLVQLG